MKIINFNGLFDKKDKWYYKIHNREEAKKILDILNKKGFVWHGTQCNANSKNVVVWSKNMLYPWYLEYSNGTLSYNNSGIFYPPYSHKNLNF